MIFEQLPPGDYEIVVVDSQLAFRAIVKLSAGETTVVDPGNYRIAHKRPGYIAVSMGPETDGLNGIQTVAIASSIETSNSFSAPMVRGNGVIGPLPPDVYFVSLFGVDGRYCGIGGRVRVDEDQIAETVVQRWTATREVGWLGAELTRDGEAGLMVSSLDERGILGRMGVREGDRIMKVNGQRADLLMHPDCVSANEVSYEIVTQRGVFRWDVETR